MMKKIAHTEENILGFTFDEAGELVPFWEDNEPREVRLNSEGVGHNITSLTMVHSGPRGQKPPRK